jgi:SAM-dependent methyltransferase
MSRLTKYYRTKVKPSAISLFNQFFSSPRHVNIGGGPKFTGLRWLNLDSSCSRINPNPYTLSSNCSFPLEPNSIKTVYNSHNLEHLDTNTVHRVLSEAYRVLESSGHLVLKLPDYDHVITRWNEQDYDYFQNEWSLNNMIWTWKNRNLPDTLDNRVAVIFCSFWNDYYGDHYSIDSNIKHQNAYHGPPIVSSSILQGLKTGKKPSEIAEFLRSIVVKDESSYYFNHQSAWGKDELASLVTSHGFKVISTSTNEVIDNFSYIPGIRTFKKISQYLSAKKTD